MPIFRFRSAIICPHMRRTYIAKLSIFNHSFASRAGDSQQEEIAHRIAWAAVKRSYVKANGQWVALPRRRFR
jgi:cation transport regulator ChaB